MGKSDGINNSGFTLIEVLTAINISFLLVAMIYAFYLFALKYTASTIKNIDTKNEISTLLFYINRELNEAAEMKFISLNNRNILIVNKTDTISFYNKKIDLKRIYGANNIDEYELNITTENGEKIGIRNEIIIEKPKLYNIEEGIESSQIDKIELEITKNENKYKLKFANKGKAIRTVRNITLKKSEKREF